MDTNATRWVLGHKITPHETTGNYDLMMGETPAGVKGPPPHSHRAFKEVFLITEGEMEFMLNGEIKVLKPGDSVDIAPDMLHTFSNTSDKPCKWVNIHSPKGFRDFFDKVGVPASQEDAFNSSLAPEIIGEVIQTASNYDMYIQI